MFTHVDQQNQPCMVNIKDKKYSKRYAKATSQISLPKEVMTHFKDGEIHSKKGAVFQTAIIAATMAVKNTSSLIPFCHPLPIDGCDINISVRDEKMVDIECAVHTTYKTGVEMEALTGASVAALTIYDMCKAFSQDMVIHNTCLKEKTGGKNDIMKGEK